MIIIGVDEVGRGCWAGPLVAAAVALDLSGPALAGLADSKKLSRRQRESLDNLIRQHAPAIGIGWVQPEAIDSGGITAAVKDAMTKAVSDALARQAPHAEITVIIDGSYNFLSDFVPLGFNTGRVHFQTQVGADGLVPAVSAASIIAKVARDRYMAEDAHARYPAYGFDRHVGYGTAAHIAALAEHGVTPLHRMSYKPIQKFLTAGGGLLQS